MSRTIKPKTPTGTVPGEQTTFTPQERPAADDTTSRGQPQQQSASVARAFFDRLANRAAPNEADVPVDEAQLAILLGKRRAKALLKAAGETTSASGAQPPTKRSVRDLYRTQAAKLEQSYEALRGTPPGAELEAHIAHGRDVLRELGATANTVSFGGVLLSQQDSLGKVGQYEPSLIVARELARKAELGGTELLARALERIELPSALFEKLQHQLKTIPAVAAAPSKARPQLRLDVDATVLEEVLVKRSLEKVAGRGFENPGRLAELVAQRAVAMLDYIAATANDVKAGAPANTLGDTRLLEHVVHMQGLAPELQLASLRALAELKLQPQTVAYFTTRGRPPIFDQLVQHLGGHETSRQLLLRIVAGDEELAARTLWAMRAQARPDHALLDLPTTAAARARIAAKLAQMPDVSPKHIAGLAILAGGSTSLSALAAAPSTDLVGPTEKALLAQPGAAASLKDAAFRASIEADKLVGASRDVVGVLLERGSLADLATALAKYGATLDFAAPASEPILSGSLARLVDGARLKDVAGMFGMGKLRDQLTSSTSLRLLPAKLAEDVLPKPHRDSVQKQLQQAVAEANPALFEVLPKLDRSLVDFDAIFAAAVQAAQHNSYRFGFALRVFHAVGGGATLAEPGRERLLQGLLAASGSLLLLAYAGLSAEENGKRFSAVESAARNSGDECLIAASTMLELPAAFRQSWHERFALSGGSTQAGPQLAAAVVASALETGPLDATTGKLLRGLLRKAPEAERVALLQWLDVHPQGATLRAVLLAALDSSDADARIALQLTLQGLAQERSIDAELDALCRADGKGFFTSSGAALIQLCNDVARGVSGPVANVERMEKLAQLAVTAAVHVVPQPWLALFASIETLRNAGAAVRLSPEYLTHVAQLVTREGILAHPRAGELLSAGIRATGGDHEALRAHVLTNPEACLALATLWPEGPGLDAVLEKAVACSHYRAVGAQLLGTTALRRELTQGQATQVITALVRHITALNELVAEPLLNEVHAAFSAASAVPDRVQTLRHCIAEATSKNARPWQDLTLTRTIQLERALNDVDSLIDRVVSAREATAVVATDLAGRVGEAVCDQGALAERVIERIEARTRATRPSLAEIDLAFGDAQVAAPVHDPRDAMYRARGAASADTVQVLGRPLPVYDGERTVAVPAQKAMVEVPTFQRNADAVVERVFVRRQPLVFLGPSGAAKTSTVTWLCALTGTPCFRLNGHPNATEEDFFGKWTLDRHGNPKLEPADFLRVFEKGGVILIDEFNFYPPAIQKILVEFVRAMKEGVGTFTVGGQTLTLQPSPNARLVLAGNFGMRGNQPIEADLRDHVYFAEGIPPDELALIVSQQFPSVPPAQLQKACELHFKLEAIAADLASAPPLTVRNLLRLASRLERFGTDGKQDDAVLQRECREIYLDGIWGQADRERATKLFREHFGMAADASLALGGADITVTVFDDRVRLGEASLPRGPLPPKKLDELTFSVGGLSVPVVATPALMRLVVQIAKAYMMNETPLLIGDNDSAKQLAFRVVAALTGWPLDNYEMHAKRTLVHLLGTDTARTSESGALETFYSPGAMTQKAMDGGHLVLRNINTARAALLGRLNPILEEERVFSLTNGQPVEVDPGAHFGATIQIQGGTVDELNHATANRMTPIYVPPMSEAETVALLERISERWGAPVLFAKSVELFAQRWRALLDRRLIAGTVDNYNLTNGSLETRIALLADVVGTYAETTRARTRGTMTEDEQDRALVEAFVRGALAYFHVPSAADRERLTKLATAIARGDEKGIQAAMS